jgi:hypothetical protein
MFRDSEKIISKILTKHLVNQKNCRTFATAFAPELGEMAF